MVEIVIVTSGPRSSERVAAHGVESWHRVDGRDIALHKAVEGAHAGGLQGNVTDGWLPVRCLVVGPNLRGRGVGRAFVGRTEQIACARALRGLFPDTYGVQAPTFCPPCRH